MVNRVFHLNKTPVGGGSYVGPGDLVSFSWWGGLRAYNAVNAALLVPLIDIQDNGAAHTATIHCLSNGQIDATTLGAFITANGTTYVTRIYDQSGGGQGDLLQATQSSMPTILATGGPSGGPSITTTVGFIGGMATAGTVASSIPFSVSCVAMSPSSAGGYAKIVRFNSFDFVGPGNSANTWSLFCGLPVASYSLSPYTDDGLWHASQSLFTSPGTSDILYNDGHAFTGTSTGTDFTNPGPLEFGVGSFIGYMTEMGVSTSDLSASFAALNSNQHGTNGYNF